MSNTILIKRSGTANAVPASGNLSLGELAINYTDGNLFYKDGGGTVQTIASRQFVSVFGNITGANVNTGGLSLSGNVLSAINSTSNITTSGNISGNYILGNGAFLSGIDTTLISNGTSNVQVVAANGNVAINIGGTSNIAVFSNTGAYITGLISANGNITGGNLNAAGLSLSSNVLSDINSTSNITTTANAAIGNLLTDGLYHANGVAWDFQQPAGSNTQIQYNDGAGGFGASANFTFNDSTQLLTVTGTESVTGNIIAGNISTTGPSGNITGANVISATTLSASSSVITANLSATGIVDFVSSGNISLGNVGNIHIGGGSNGYLLTTNGAGNLTWTQTASTSLIFNGNSNVTIPNADGNVYINANAATDQQWNFSTDGNLSAPGNIITTANVDAANFNGNVFGTTVSASGNVTGANVNTGGLSLSGNVLSNINSTSDITTSANVNAADFNGNVYGNTVSASGNITGANVNTGGLSLSGNVLSEINSTSNIITTANVNAANFNGNVYGTTVSASGNIDGNNINGAGLSLSSNVLSALNSTSAITTTANITGGNIITSGSSGNIFGANVISGTTLSATGNVVSGNVNTGQLSLSGNVISDINTTSNITTTATITGGNVYGSFISSSGNVDGSNVNVSTAVYTPSIVGNTAISIVTVSNGNINLTPNGVGNIVLSNTIINGLAEPLQNQDAATKYYVDNAVTTGFSFHAPVFVSTNTDLNTATGGTVSYNQVNGVGNGIGATLTTTGTFYLVDTGNIQTVDTRVLVKNEANATWNGVYTYANTTAIVRSTDTDQYGSDSAESFSINDYFFTQSGNVNAGSAFVVSAPPGVIIFGTSNIEFAQFSSTQVYSANTNAGLSLNGTVFSAKVDNDTTAFDNLGNIIVKASANLVTPNIGNATGQTLSLTGNLWAGNVDAGSGFISTSGNVTGGNFLTGGLISATGNITGGNISTTGSGGNISGANVISGTTLSATGNVIAGNLNASGLSLSSNVVSNLNVTTNIAGGNISTVGLLTAKDFSITGNIIGNLVPSANATYNLGSSSYLWKDLYLAGNSLYLGAQTITSNATGVSVGSADFAAGNINATGNVSATGNVNTGNVVNGGGNLTLTANTKIWNFSNNGNLYVPESSQIRASSSFYGVTVSDYASLATLSLVDDATLQGNAYVRLQVIGGTQFDFTNGLANIKDANLSTTGNVIGGNILFGTGIVSGTGNVTAGNVIFGAGIVSGTGNVYGNNFVGNVVATFASVTGNITGGNVLFGGNAISGTGNITGGNIFQGIYQVLDTASTVDGGLY